jgi:hypothetical protein
MRGHTSPDPSLNELPARHPFDARCSSRPKGCFPTLLSDLAAAAAALRGR